MNKAILIGRMTKDPEIKYTAINNIPVCKFTLAVDRRFKKEGEERQADFISMVAWRSTAEFITNYFSKGKKIGVVGSIQTRNWEDDDGKRHYATEVVVDEAYFVDSAKNKDSNNSSNTEKSGSSTSAQEKPKTEPKSDADEGFYEINDSSDELPF
jgi:single-strand DNA-binding protein